MTSGKQVTYSAYVPLKVGVTNSFRFNDCRIGDCTFEPFDQARKDKTLNFGFNDWLSHCEKEDIDRSRLLIICKREYPSDLGEDQIKNDLEDEYSTVLNLLQIACNLDAYPNYAWFVKYSQNNDYIILGSKKSFLKPEFILPGRNVSKCAIKLSRILYENYRYVQKNKISRLMIPFTLFSYINRIGEGWLRLMLIFSLLECLYVSGKRRRNKIKELGERLSLFLYRRVRSDIKEKIETAYRIRSDIIHGSFKEEGKLTEQLLKDVYNYSSKSWLKIMLKLSNIETFADDKKRERYFEDFHKNWKLHKS